MSEAAATEPGAFRIKQFHVDPTTDEVRISWESASGLSYDLLSETDLSTPTAT